MNGTILRWCLIITLVICGNQITFTQSSDIDPSLESLWNKVSNEIGAKHYSATFPLLENIMQLADAKKEYEHYVSAQFFTAYSYFHLDSLAKFKSLIDKAHDNTIAVFGNEDTLCVNTDIYFYYGKYYYKVGDLESASHYYEKTLALLERGIPFSFRKRHVYNNLGSTCQKKGEYTRAINFLKYDLNKRLSSSSKVKRFKNLGVCYRYLEEPEIAANYYHSALHELDKIKKTKKTKISKDNIMINLAGLYSFHEVYDSAQYYLNKVIPAFLPKKDYFFYYKEMAVLAFKTNRIKESQWYYEQAFNSAYKGEYNATIPRTFQQKGEMQASIGAYDEAIVTLQKGIQSLSRNKFDVKNLQSIPSIDDVFSIPHLIWIIESKAKVLLQSGKKKDALDQYKKLNALLKTFISKRIVTDYSKLFWLKYSKTIFQQAIPLALELGDQAFAYEMVQQSHGSLLYSGLQGSEAIKFGKVPDSLIQQELRYRIDVTAKITELFKDEPDIEVDEVSGNKKHLFDLKKKHHNLLKTIEQTYPDFYQLKYASPSVTMAEVQASIPNNTTTLIEYFVGESKVYIFALTKNDMEIFVKSKDTQFQNNIDLFRSSISTFTLKKDMYLNYLQSSQYLYNILLKDVIDHTPEVKDFVIIPDDVLGYISFSALLDQTTEFNENVRYDLLPYLVKKYNISYSYSAPLFVEFIRKKVPLSTQSLIGFAPNFGGESSIFRQGQNLDSLVHNIEEVKLISDIVGGEIFIDSTATLANFKEKIGQYKLAHLSTHANCSDSNPMESKIHFHDDFVTIKEIYNLSSNLELITLSACETGAGSLAKGEGIISMARAFMYSGCQSVLTSLWKVNDRQTVELMEYFYKAISNEEYKHHALANAQRKYLSNVKAASLAHPFYWATFIQIGNLNPVLEEDKTNFPFFYLGVGVLFILGFLFLTREKIR